MQNSPHLPGADDPAAPGHPGPEVTGLLDPGRPRGVGATGARPGRRADDRAGDGVGVRGARPGRQAELIRRFAADFKATYYDHEKPSYTTLMRRMDAHGAAGPHTVSRTTIHRAFAGEVLPSWNTTWAILLACRVPEDEIASWKSYWSSVSKLVDGVVGGPPPGNETGGAGTSGPPGGTPATSCPECGSTVIDRDLHEQWHRNYIRRPALKVVGDSYPTR